MSKPPLNDRTKRELVELARRRGIASPDSLSKDALIKALTNQTKKSRPGRKPSKVTLKTSSRPAKNHAPASRVKRDKPSRTKSTKSTTTNGSSKTILPKPVLAQGTKPEVVKPMRPALTSRVEAAIPADKDLSTKSNKVGTPIKDRIVLTAPDPFWLHAFWELSQQSVQRAEAALGQDWHGAKPIIRLFDVTSQDTTSTSESVVRDVTLHGGCNRWYLDVAQPPRSYRADIGYLTRSGRFFPLSRSNVIAPPKAGASEAIEEKWSDGTKTSNADDVIGGREIPDDQFRRPLKDAPFGSGAVLPTKLKKFFFDVDAELIVYVKTDSSASVTLQNEPVKLRPDGTAIMRFSLPDSRQIIPAVATSADGMEEQTIVLAVERNTKRLDPMIHDLYTES